MARNSVTGCLRDIEIAFSNNSDHTTMRVRNLVDTKKRVRVMYQKLAMSGLANWTQFELTSKPIMRRLPTEILEAYRLTFFVDDTEPVSVRVEKILDELKGLKAEQLTETTTQNTVDAVPPLQVGLDADEPLGTEIQATQQAEETTGAPEPATTSIDEITPETEAAQQVEEDTAPLTPKAAAPAPAETGQQPEAKRTRTPVVSKLSPTWKTALASHTIDVNKEFKVAIPSLPPSALKERRKAEAAAKLENGNTNPDTRLSKQKKRGPIGHIFQALGLAPGGRRGKTYYQEKGEAIQNEFQNRLAKLERDYNDGYGLNLLDWDPETLSEAETAILLLNLMVNEVIAWRKETGRAKYETAHLIQTLDEVDTRLRRILKETRGVSAPSPTLFPDLLAENERDLEKIQNECDAYLQRFTGKLAEQEKKHATKIQVVLFKKFLIGFIRDFLFVEVTKNMKRNALPERLPWFLELVDSEVTPIEVGVTKVSQNHHEVTGTLDCEFEPGTIAKVITPGLQSKDGKRVSQRAVVIQAG